MSGQKNKKPSDMVKYRQEYLDSLNLQVDLNNANEQAVKQYVSTGQVPPISQMKDTRSTTEKLLDVEKLKISLIKDLEPIADPQFAQMIISAIIQSPLNQDNRLLQFTAQRIDDIVKNLKKNYKYGIKGDMNDAVQFVFFINKMFSDKNKVIEGTKSFINRMGASSEGIASARLQVQHTTLSNLASEYKSYITNNTLYLGVLAAGGIIPIPTDLNLTNILQNNIGLKFKALLQILPVSLTTIQQMEQINFQDVGTTGYGALADSLDEFLDFINHSIPSTDYIQTIIDDLRKSNIDLRNIQSQDAFDFIYKRQIIILQNLDAILNIDLPSLGAMERLSARARVKIAEQPYRPETMTQRATTAAEAAKWQDLVDRIQNNINIIGNPANAAARPIGLEPLAPNPNPLAGNVSFAARQAAIAPAGGVATVEDIPKLEQLQKDTYNYIAKYELAGVQMQGMGIGRIRGKGLTRADYTQGIEPSARYIKFGRYMINNKKLNDNVLSLRRSKGSTIATIPNNKMTSELSHVFKTIVGGGVPSYDDLNSLTEAEKRYLHKVSQEADIYDKIKIPTPNKDEEEKDIHLFNVMKGEILAGNDSKELISKFKKLLNKLSRTNVLPKSQVREILEELLELGY